MVNGEMKVFLEGSAPAPPKNLPGLNTALYTQHFPFGSPEVRPPECRMNSALGKKFVINHWLKPVAWVVFRTHSART